MHVNDEAQSNPAPEAAGLEIILLEGVLRILMGDPAQCGLVPTQETKHTAAKLMELFPGLRQFGRESHVSEHFPGEFGVEAVEELFVVQSHHGFREVVELRVLEVTLRVPGRFDGLSSRDAAAHVLMDDFFEPRSKRIEPCSRLDPP